MALQRGQPSGNINSCPELFGKSQMSRYLSETAAPSLDDLSRPLNSIQFGLGLLKHAHFEEVKAQLC